MLTLKENTTLIGVSEFRAKIESILEKMQTTRVVIEKRHKPVAVLISSSEYQKFEELLDMAENIVLGYLAKERFNRSNEKDYISIETVLKKIGS
ncbi:MAG: type II toxin-antitoxin system prevent-host-death family antitoxin [Elusimicrobiota bacterium]